MYPLNLPEPAPADGLPFRDGAAAGAWLASQSQTQPQLSLVALQKVIAAIDGADIPPMDRLAILDVLRAGVIKTQSALESRYTHRPLPLVPAEADIFFASRKLWRTLAVAYLRTVAGQPPDLAIRPLHRAALALRLEQYAHFLAAYEVPGDLFQLLYGVLSLAEELGIQETPLEDPSYKQMGDSHIAGHVACALLLHYIDPYRLSVAELTVTHRALSRWRELATFEAVPDSDPKARSLPLAPVVGEACLAAGRSRWLNVRMVVRKVRRRLESLESGEGPEALQLGRELSATACIRLLRQLKDALRPGNGPMPAAAGEVEASLVFDASDIYAMLSGKRLEQAPAPAPSKSVDYQRLAVFGFDKMEIKTAPEAPVEVPGETWQVAGNLAARMDGQGRRLSAPCLAAVRMGPKQAPRLAVLTSLQERPGGRLHGTLQWFEATAKAVSILLPSAGGKEAPVAAFVLEEKTGRDLVLPPSVLARPDSRLKLDGKDGSESVLLGKVLERGSDFVRYAIQPS